MTSFELNNSLTLKIAKLLAKHIHRQVGGGGGGEGFSICWPSPPILRFGMIVKLVSVPLIKASHVTI